MNGTTISETTINIISVAHQDLCKKHSSHDSSVEFFAKNSRNCRKLQKYLS